MIKGYRSTYRVCGRYKVCSMWTLSLLYDRGVVFFHSIDPLHSSHSFSFLPNAFYLRTPTTYSCPLRFVSRRRFFLVGLVSNNTTNRNILHHRTHHHPGRSLRSHHGRSHHCNTLDRRIHCWIVVIVPLDSEKWRIIVCERMSEWVSQCFPLVF